MKQKYTQAIDYSKSSIYSNYKIIHGHKIEMKMLNMKRHKNFVDTNETIPREEIQPQLDIIYNHLKNVLCSGNEQQYDFFYELYCLYIWRPKGEKSNNDDFKGTNWKRCDY